MKTQASVIYYNGHTASVQKPFDIHENRLTAELKIKDAVWQCQKSTGSTTGKANDIRSIAGSAGTQTAYTFQLEKGKAQKAGVSVNFTFSDWGTENYVILPAAVYNGNRFDVLKYGYPPLFKPKDFRKDLPVTITDVPRLNKDTGLSRLDLNTGDLSTPAIGIYFPKTKKGIWIITEQATQLGNSVLTFKENNQRTEAQFSIAAPSVREKYYSMMKLSPSSETGTDLKEGDKVTIRYKIFTFDNLSSPKDLNNKFLSIRKSFGTTANINQLPFSKAFHLMEKQENKWWSEKDSIYTLGGDGWNMHWQLGWVGGLMVTLPLSEIGGDSSHERSFKNYQKIITQSQAKSGFFYSCGNSDNQWCSDCFSAPFPDSLLLLRKNADALYYIYKYCLSERNRNPAWKMPPQWAGALTKLSEAFVKLWKQNHQFGQFINIETGEIKVGGSNSAVMAIGGLVLASEFEHKPEWLNVARAAASYYYKNFTLKGISCGGPGEILQNNDAESAFASLESFMTLYEHTGAQQWLQYAKDAASLCATWMFSYDYTFPSKSLFGRLDMKTSGAVWASTQNKHGGPGICTLSGDCLFKLYRATGNKLYLGMIRELAHNIMQYISRDDRPIKDQETGWINERVNMSDWEGKDRIGDIFHGNTWAQVSAMLTVAEIPGIYINPTKKELTVMDHVEAKFSDNTARTVVITNPTKFDADVRVFIETDRSQPYPQGFISTCPITSIKAGETKEYRIEGKHLIAR